MDSNEELRRKLEAAEAWIQQIELAKQQAEQQAEQAKQQAKQQVEQAKQEAEQQAEQAKQQAKQQVEQAKQQAEQQAEQAKQQAKQQVEQAEQQAEQAKQQAEQAKQQAKQQVEQVEQQAEARIRLAETETQEARMQLAPTSFLDYIRGVEQHLYMTLTIGPDPKKQSRRGATTAVEGKFYPQHFQPWTDFKALHEETFATLTATFGDAPLFRSMANLEDSGRELSPVPKDELDLRPFIRASIEKPAASVINRYLLRTQDDIIDNVIFRNNAYGVQLEGEEAARAASDPHQSTEASDESPPRKRKSRSPIKTRFPDRWLFASHHDGKLVRALVGEYKAAHSLPHQKLTRVMSAPPGDNFFPRITKQISQDLDSETTTAATTDADPDNDGSSGEVYVARVICQAYDYMLSTGVEFGYVASGDGLIFLRVPEDDPNTLYYFWSVFPVDETTRLAPREPEETAMAYLTTLCMRAIRTSSRPFGWIVARDIDVKRWPSSKKAKTLLSEATLPLQPSNRDDDNGDGAGPDPGPSSRLVTLRSAGTRSSSRKRTRDDADTHREGGSSSGQQTRPQLPPMGPFVFEPPTLPYCTQACLRGLCQRLPLDDRCPNVVLHRAATQNEHGDDYRDNHHPLTVDAVRSRIVAQLAANMDKDFQCLDGYGCWGLHGVLFKLTVTGFGYTFVAKAVQAVHRHILENEQAVYGALAAFQGTWIPVCLGLVDLVWAVPLQSFARMRHMLLLSYAGPDLKSTKQLPDNVNLDAEANRTVRALAAIGLRHDDIREENLVWNAEVGRVMQIDFGSAFIRGGKVVTPAGDVVVHEDAPAGTVTAEPAAVEAAEPDAALQPCSPLADKRDLNAHKSARHGCGDSKQHAKKRARVARVGKTGRTTR